MGRWDYARWDVSRWDVEDDEMPAVATLNAGVITDSVPGTVRRDQASAVTGSDGRGGPVVSSNPSFAGGSTTGWSSTAGCTLTAPADTAFGQNFPYCGRMVLAAGGAGRSILTQLVNVQTDLGLSGVLLAYVEGGGAATLVVRLQDPSLVGVIATATTVTLTGDVQAIPYAFTSGQLAGYANPYLELAGTDATAQVLRVTHAAPQPPADSSIGMYEASAPVFAHCFPTSVEGWTALGTGTVTWSADHGKFGTHSLKVVSGGAGDCVFAGVIFTAAATTKYAPGYWIWRTETSATIQVRYNRQDGGVSFGQTTIAATLGGQFVSTPFTTDGSTSGFYPIISASANVTFYVGAAWADPGSVTLPFPGDGGTRAAARCQLPQNLISQKQGWIAFRLRPGWAVGAAPHAFPVLFNAFGGNLLADYQQSGDRWAIGRNDASGAGAGAFVAGTHAANAGVTVIPAWDASHVSISLDAAAFVTPVGNTKSPAPGGTLFDIGDNGSTVVELDARVLWVAGGTGDYTRLDLSKGYWTADTDPVLATINADSPGAGCTFVYPCADASMAAMPMAATGAWTLTEAYGGTFAAGPLGTTQAPPSYGPVPGTPQAQMSFNPGSAYRLSLGGAKDANGLTLDPFTASVTAEIDALDGTVPLVSQLIPAGVSGAWSATIPGDAFAVGAAQALTARLSDPSGAATRLAASFGLEPAEPVKLGYQALQEWPLVVSGLNLPSGWTGTITVVDRAGHGPTQVAADALVPVGTTGAQYAIDSSVMVAGGALLVTVQFLSSGGAKLLCRRYLLTAGW